MVAEDRAVSQGITLSDQMDAYFGKNRFNLIYNRSEEPVFYHMRDNQSTIDIIGIRGTKSTVDKLQDILLFVDIASLQVCQTH